MIEAVAFHHDPASNVDEKFSPLTAVHVANALEDETSDPLLDQQPGNPLQIDYLERLGIADRVDSWRELAANCADTV